MKIGQFHASITVKPDGMLHAHLPLEEGRYIRVKARTEIFLERLLKDEIYARGIVTKVHITFTRKQ